MKNGKFDTSTYISGDRKKTVRDRKLKFFFIEKLSKFPFIPYIVLNKKYKM